MSESKQDNNESRQREITSEREAIMARVRQLRAIALGGQA